VAPSPRPLLGRIGLSAVALVGTDKAMTDIKRIAIESVQFLQDLGFLISITPEDISNSDLIDAEKHDAKTRDFVSKCQVRFKVCDQEFSMYLQFVQNILVSSPSASDLKLISGTSFLPPPPN
jgi:hypothetical protein